MSTAQQILADVKAEQLEQWQLDDREAELIKQCRKSNYPIVMQVVLMVVGMCLLLGITLALFRDLNAIHRFGMLIGPVFLVLSTALTAIQIQSRRAKALAELIQMKAPGLHEELKNKGVL